MAKILMIQGTMSNVGKSIITAGLCRIFSQDGYKVAPFKSQNMALNSFITENGLEMGRAQVVQAEACGIKPDVRMNPILLKPTNDVGSQVIVNGEILEQMDAKTYFSIKSTLKSDIMKAFHSLSEEFDIIVVEGAGSPVEINLNSDDIVNMGLAEMIDAPVILVGDIDRGGIFATLYGTISLMNEQEKNRVKGVLINKFRGDLDILKPGLVQLEEITARSVVGVVPYMSLNIEDEDSLSHHLEKKYQPNTLNIAVIYLPKMSNFSDFNSLSTCSGVNLSYIKSISDLNTDSHPDLLILPGTKNTIADMKYLRESGFEAVIKKLVTKGVPLFGICGGFQMLGCTISDPQGVEEQGNIHGFGYFPMKTQFGEEKITKQIKGQVHKLEGFFSSLSGADFNGYEMHMGESFFHKSSVLQEENKKPSPFSLLNQEKDDGYVCDNVFGTYAHGIFDSGNFRDQLISLLLEKKGILQGNESEIMSYEEFKEREFNRLAHVLRESLDMEKIYSILDGKEP